MVAYYCNTFTGHNPVGTSAIIVARNPTQAARILEEELKLIKLEQTISPKQMTKINTKKIHAIILQDGDY